MENQVLHSYLRKKKTRTGSAKTGGTCADILNNFRAQYTPCNRYLTLNPLISDQRTRLWNGDLAIAPSSELTLGECLYLKLYFAETRATTSKMLELQKQVNESLAETWFTLFHQIRSKPVQTTALDWSNQVLLANQLLLATMFDKNPDQQTQQVKEIRGGKKLAERNEMLQHSFLHKVRQFFLRNRNPAEWSNDELVAMFRSAEKKGGHIFCLCRTRWLECQGPDSTDVALYKGNAGVEAVLASFGPNHMTGVLDAKSVYENQEQESLRRHPVLSKLIFEKCIRDGSWKTGFATTAVVLPYIYNHACNTTAVSWYLFPPSEILARPSFQERFITLTSFKKGYDVKDATHEQLYKKHLWSTIQHLLPKLREGSQHHVHSQHDRSIDHIPRILVGAFLHPPDAAANLLESFKHWFRTDARYGKYQDLWFLYGHYLLEQKTKGKNSCTLSFNKRLKEVEGKKRSKAAGKTEENSEKNEHYRRVLIEMTSEGGVLPQKRVILTCDAPVVLHPCLTQMVGAS